MNRIYSKEVTVYCFKINELAHFETHIISFLQTKKKKTKPSKKAQGF